MDWMNIGYPGAAADPDKVNSRTKAPAKAHLWQRLGVGLFEDARDFSDSVCDRLVGGAQVHDHAPRQHFSIRATQRLREQHWPVSLAAKQPLSIRPVGISTPSHHQM